MYQCLERQLKMTLFPSELIIESSEWFKLESIMPWIEIEELLSPIFSDIGRKAVPARHILGALIIQSNKGLSDRQTIITIKETPMLQYFLGLNQYIKSDIFDFTLLCKYRKIIGVDLAKEMIETLLKAHNIIMPSIEAEPKNKGSMSIDASVVPVNITYPTDLKLLNQVREKTEEIIDQAHENAKQVSKPRTYRKLARADYLSYAKAKRLSKNKRFNANRKQLQYIKRNIENIDDLVTKGFYKLSEAHEESLETCRTVYNQQYQMWSQKENRVDDRIVSLSQPHIRCIVRGKAGKMYEFGPKIAVSKVNGFIHLDHISFDNFNESRTLENLTKKYKRLHGAYPQVIRADKIYQTRANKVLCKSLGIRLSGKPLGRPKKETTDEDKQFIEKDFKERLEIEGVFGVAKTKYGLAKLMTKLLESQQASIGLVFFVMNLNQIKAAMPFYANFEMLVLQLKYNEEEFIYED